MPYCHCVETVHTKLHLHHAIGVTRAVAFSQYPHWSCTTSGSRSNLSVFLSVWLSEIFIFLSFWSVSLSTCSLNHLWRSLKSKGLESQIQWSILDRWPLHAGFIQVFLLIATAPYVTIPPRRCASGCWKPCLNSRATTQWWCFRRTPCLSTS